jgi:hypothetical protein
VRAQGEKPGVLLLGEERVATMIRSTVWLGILGLIATATQSVAQQLVPVPPDQPARVYGYVFPVEYEGAKRLSVRRYGDPRLGYSVGYRHGPIALTIYIYDQGRKSIPGDPDDPIIARELMSSIKGDAKAEIKDAFPVSDERKITRVYCVWLLRHENNIESGICLGAAKNKFIKLVASARPDPDAFNIGVFAIRGWLPFFWPPS